MPAPDDHDYALWAKLFITAVFVPVVAVLVFTEGGQGSAFGMGVLTLLGLLWGAPKGKGGDE